LKNIEIMKKNLPIILVLSLSILLILSCDKKTANKPVSAKKPEVKKGIKPIADSEIAVIEMQEPAFGKIKLELYSNIAPEMVKRFKELAKEGFYNGTTFHRTESIVIQGGDPNSKDDNPGNDGMGKSDKPNVAAELSDIPFDIGTLGAARSAEYDSANCQFYITLQRYPSWDGNYTAFGKVVDGMNNAFTISGVPKGATGAPAEKVVIKSITFENK
jgi:cyclophilin family peptidyl-prolyl cis-trans isomerase